LLFKYRTRTLKRHGTLRLYHLPGTRQITTRCRIANGWETHTQTLFDAGVIRNATKCSITTNEFQTLPEIRGEIQSTIVNTHFYVPDQIQIVADHEIPLIKQISPEEEVTRLDEVKSKVKVPSQSYDVNSLFRIEQASARRYHKTYRHQITTISVCAVAILGVIYLSLRTPLRNLATRCLLPNTVHEPSTTAQNPSQLQTYSSPSRDATSATLCLRASRKFTPTSAIIFQIDRDSTCIAVARFATSQHPYTTVNIFQDQVFKLLREYYCK